MSCSLSEVFRELIKMEDRFWDVDADRALLNTLRSAGLECPIEELDTDIDDPSLSAAAISALHRMIQSVDKHL
ncbi:hypothetical protein J3R83DRAFT_2192 [Lanmaoa asiatica]|nr:hypothetical protein J3R83DRAFT_2192 [Lanmaoa asiatica]